MSRTSRVKSVSLKAEAPWLSVSFIVRVFCENRLMYKFEAASWCLKDMDKLHVKRRLFTTH